MTEVGRPLPTTAGAEFVILNQYYVPDVASTGHLLAELAHESAALGRKVSVVSSFPSYGPPETWQPCEAKEVCDGVSIWRMKTTRFRKDSLLLSRQDSEGIVCRESLAQDQQALLSAGAADHRSMRPRKGTGGA